MDSEKKNNDAKAIIPEDKQSLAARSSALISRGLRDLTYSLDSILVEMAKALVLSQSVERTVGYMFEKANEVLRSENYSLFLMDSEKDDLSWSPPFGDYRDFKPTHIKIGEGVAEVGYLDTPIKRTGVGLAGLVARTGQVVVVPDTSKDSRFVMEVDGKGTTEARSIVAAPVRLSDRCLGVIELINCVGPDGFSRRSLVLLEALADFAAIAIENTRHVMAIHKLTITDKDTALYNEWHLNFILDTEIDRSERYSYEFSLIEIDLNIGFRDVPVGVWLSCLAQVGKGLEAACRLIDFAFRYGDTRFAILLPQTAKDAACRVARDLSRQFAKAEWLWHAGRTVKLPACVGVVSFPKDAATKNELLKLAEETMSLVRRTGRGGVAAANVGILQLEDSGTN